MTTEVRSDVVTGDTVERGWGFRARTYFLKNEWLRGYTLLSPTLLTMFCLLALPVFMLITYSLWSQTYVYIDESFTLKNYETFFSKWVYGKVLLRSIWMSGTVTIVTILLAYPVAYFLAFRVRKNKMTWLILINIPFVTSYLLRVLSWKIMLGNNGVINGTLEGLGFIEAPLEYLLYSRFAVIVTLAHAWAAFAILPIFVSLQKIDRSLFEAAADLGDGPVKRFFRITLPLSMPGVIAAAIIEFIPTVGDYITPIMVGGPKGIMIGQIIATQFGAANNWPLGAALTIIIMISITGICCAVIWFSRMGTVRAKDMEATQARGEPHFARPRGFDWLLAYVVIYLLFLYIPSAMLPIFSFNDSIQMVLPLKAFTLKWYQALPDQPGLIKALITSLKIAVPVAIVTTTLATFAAKALTRYRMPGRSLAIGFILLPMVMPGIIMSVGLLVLALAVGMKLSIWAVGISHVVVTVPFATLVIMARLEGFNKNIEEASLDLGLGPWMTFWRVTFPLIMPAIGASLLLTFTASFDEFLFALFLGGSDVTLPVYIWTQVRFPQTLPSVLALGALIFMVTIVLVITAEWLRRMGDKHVKANAA
jgi:spermidine/putrescine transport system permease protein